MTGGTRYLRIVAAALMSGVLLGVAGPASAQSRDTQSQGLFTGSIGGFRLFGGPPAPPAPVSKDDWSGESGSSGHPLMQADAIRAAAANFDNCLAGYWPDAARRGVTRATFETYTSGLTPDLKIMDLINAQPEFTKAL